MGRTRPHHLLTLALVLLAGRRRRLVAEKLIQRRRLAQAYGHRPQLVGALGVGVGGGERVHLVGELSGVRGAVPSLLQPLSGLVQQQFRARRWVFKVLFQLRCRRVAALLCRLQTRDELTHALLAGWLELLEVEREQPHDHGREVVDWRRRRDGEQELRIPEELGQFLLVSPAFLTDGGLVAVGARVEC